MTIAEYVFSSLKGKSRSENSDGILIVNTNAFFIFMVFDGVSSAKNGKQAVLKAKQFIKDRCKSYENQVPDLKQLMYQVHLHLLEIGISEPYTTYCMVLLNRQSGVYYYSWLGDSRIYLINESSMEVLTQDDCHSEHVITKCLGHPNLNIRDFRQKKILQKKGHLLLCTDGFYRICESHKTAFFECMMKQSLPELKTAIESLIIGKNTDDSTFIIII